MIVRDGFRLAAVVLVSAVLGGCGSGDPRRSTETSPTTLGQPTIGSDSVTPGSDSSPLTTTDASIPTVRQVIASVDAELAAHRDEILVTRVTGQNTLAPGVDIVVETYSDIANAVVRQIVRGNDRMEETNSWVDERQIVVEAPGGNIRTTPSTPCEGMTMLVSIVLSCEAAEPDSSTTVEIDAEGRPVLVLSASVPQATQVNPSCSGATCPTVAFVKTFSRRVTLDPTTFLPVSIEEQGSIDLGGVSYEQRIVATLEFVDPATLPAGFFTPPVA